jgi:hypothetical protein
LNGLQDRPISTPAISSSRDISTARSVERNQGQNYKELTNMNRHPFATIPKISLEKFTLQFISRASVVETLVIWTDYIGKFPFSFLAIPDKNFRPLQYMQ